MLRRNIRIILIGILTVIVTTIIVCLIMAVSVHAADNNGTYTLCLGQILDIEFDNKIYTFMYTGSVKDYYSIDYTESGYGIVYKLIFKDDIDTAWANDVTVFQGDKIIDIIEHDKKTNCIKITINKRV